MAAVAQRSMPLQPGAPQLCAARPDPFQQALIVCPPGFQGKSSWQEDCRQQDGVYTPLTGAARLSSPFTSKMDGIHPPTHPPIHPS
uniref:Uncharacterized protein n=1 Tax=Oryzias sinensis TaxID=183150 RepID=A0A8C7XT92_9TELE